MSEIRSESEYWDRFTVNGASTLSASKALGLAHDIRKFEIELYWKRAGYFWALIAAAFAGYFALQRQSPTGFLPLLISCVGFFLALGWYLVNRGSKYWQENWERHVDVLETNVVGPLYKTTLSKDLFGFWEFWKGYPYSVSKINQLISLFVVLVWLGLVAAAFPALPGRDRLRSLAPWLIVGVTALFAVLAFWKGQSRRPCEPRKVHFCESPLESAEQTGDRRSFYQRHQDPSRSKTDPKRKTSL